MRAIIQKIPHKDGNLDFTQNIFDGGKYVPVDLDKLIENIFVSPTSPKWIQELIESLLHKYEIDKEVKMSSLSEDPVF